MQKFTETPPLHIARSRRAEILKAILIDGRRPAHIAREMGISKQRMSQILYSCGVQSRPLAVFRPDYVRRYLPDWGG